MDLLEVKFTNVWRPNLRLGSQEFFSQNSSLILQQLVNYLLSIPTNTGSSHSLLLLILCIGKSLQFSWWQFALSIIWWIKEKLLVFSFLSIFLVFEDGSDKFQTLMTDLKLEAYYITFRSMDSG